MADSSSDENYESHVNVPNVNLASLRKKDKGNTRTNLAKATKRFKPANKAVRFPDHENSPYRHSMLSTTSTTNLLNYSLDSDYDLRNSERHLEVTEADPALPNFQFHMPVSQNVSSASDLDASDMYDDRPQEIGVSSDEDAPPTDLYIGDLPAGSHETDIADIRRALSGGHLNFSGGSSKKSGGGMRGVFRRGLLASEGPLRSDTFIGRVLRFSGGNAGLSGGGLTPGASMAGDDGAIDEEKAVGGSAEDHTVELRNLDFAELNEEAQNLISAHAPEMRSAQRMRERNDELRSDELANIGTEKDNATDHIAGHSRSTTESSGQVFFQPNPDLLRDSLQDDIRDEDFLETEGDYVAPPKQVHAGVLLSLLKLYQNPAQKSLATLASDGTTLNTPMLADEQFDSAYDSKNVSMHDFTNLTKAIKQGPKKIAGKLSLYTKTRSTTPSAQQLADSDDDGYSEGEGGLDGDAANLPSFSNARPKQHKQPRSFKQDRTAAAKKVHAKFRKRNNQRLRITVHIADILQRQRFIIRICRALMMYGAPTHRLEEYMVMTLRVLEIDGQFVYFPGTMIISFGDAATRTSEVHLVRCAQGVQLSKLADTHSVYKAVIHDLIGVEEAAQKLEELMRRKNNYLPWICVFLYGLGLGSVCTWGYGGGWLDIPVAFGLGLFIGYLQFFVSSKSHLYLSIFEVTSSIVVSFAARGIGSIKGGDLFCFGAIAQGSLSLILPGYIILCGSLELQSKNLVAGSVRMFYAIIYSLFLGFGITLGASLYGWVDHNATDAAQCAAGHAIDDKWRILFVPLFSLCLGLINQARFTQLPVMILISSIAYIGTFFAGKHFADVTEFTASIGAFIIGILGNMYSRIGKGMAVSAMLPAIFVQVPSGIASKSTLLAGVQTANKITNSSSASGGSTDLSSLSFGATMVEVSIGISVGLFAAALVVYPFGKKGTSLFTL